MWTGFDFLWVGLMISWAVLFIVFMVVFERINKNYKNIDYELGRAKYWQDRWDVIDDKMSNLYTKDEHNFERPKVDIKEDNVTREMNDMHERLYKLEERMKEVNK